MKRQRKPLHLSQAILLISMIGYSSFLVLMLFMDWYLIRNYQKENTQREQDVLDQYVENVQDSMERIDRQLSDIYVNSEDFQALRKILDSATEYSRAYDLREVLRQRMMVDESFNGFYIFYGANEKAWYHVDNEKIDSSRSRRLTELLRRQIRTGERTGGWMLMNVEEDSYLTLSIEQDNITVVGIYSLQNIERTLHDGMGRTIRVILLDDTLAYKNKELEEKLNLKEEITRYSDSFSRILHGCQVQGRRIPNLNIWICTAYPVKIWNLMNLQQMFLLLLTGLSVLAVVGMIVFMNKEVLRPMRQLTNNMNTIRRGETEDVPPLTCRFQEIQEVNDTLGEMVRELKGQKILAYEETIEKNRARMQYLQLQLKPHFYLNGLKTLNALAMENETDKMQDLILSLSKHLRYLLQIEREIVPVRMEIEFAENYINMQKHVYGRPVNAEITVDQESEDCLIPALAVQTFVENSVKYVRLGSSSVPLKIQITVSYLSTENGNFVDILVQDNGQGYPEKILEEINGDVSIGTVSVGINNIKRRCLFLYGDKVEYSFSNYEGALSELIIPERREENERTAGGRSEGDC